MNNIHIWPYFVCVDMLLLSYGKSSEDMERVF